MLSRMVVSLFQTNPLTEFGGWVRMASSYALLEPAWMGMSAMGGRHYLQNLIILWQSMQPRGAAS
jgi:hypothetical protein